MAGKEGIIAVALARSYSMTQAQTGPSLIPASACPLIDGRPICQRQKRLSLVLNMCFDCTSIERWKRESQLSEKNGLVPIFVEVYSWLLLFCLLSE